VAVETGWQQEANVSFVSSKGSHKARCFRWFEASEICGSVWLNICVSLPWYDYTRLAVSTSRENRNVHNEVEADIKHPVSLLFEGALLISRDLVARIINGLSLCAVNRRKPSISYIYR
jgi:hypothetical protein